MCRMMVILCQWRFNEQTEKLVRLLLYTSEKRSRKFHAWVQSVNEWLVENTNPYGKIYIFFSPNRLKEIRK